MSAQKNLVISRSDGKVEVIPLTPGMKIKAIPGATYSVVADGVLLPAQITNDGHGNAMLKVAAEAAGVPSLIEISDYYSAAAGTGSLIFTRAEGTGQIIAVPSSSNATPSSEVKTVAPPTQVTSSSLVRGIAASSVAHVNEGSILQSVESQLSGSHIAKSVDGLNNQGLYVDAKVTPLSFKAGSDPTSGLGQLSGALIPSTEDKTPPEQAVLLNNSVGQRVLQGTGEAGATAIVMDAAGNVLARVPVDQDGRWSLDYKTTTPPLPEGLAKVRVLVQDAFGNISEPLDTTVVVDTVPPLAPAMDATIATPDGNYTTVLTNGTGATSSQKPMFTGTAGVDAQGRPEANIKINLYDNGVLIGTTVSDATGHWTIQPTTALKDGAHRFTVSGVDSSGNESPNSSVYSLTVDTKAPTGLAFIDQVEDKTQPIIEKYTSVAGQEPSLNDKRPTLSGRSGGGPGENIVVYRNGVEVATVTPSGGQWAYSEPADLVDGQYTYTTRVIDKAGNKGPSSTAFAFNVDTVAPVKADGITVLADDGVTVVGLGSVTNSRNPTIKLTAERGAKIDVYDQTTSSIIGQMTEDPNRPGTYTFVSPRLNSATYQWTFVVTDKAGNVLPVDKSSGVSFVVQTLGPPQTIFIDSMGLDSGQSSTDFITNFGGATSADGKESRLLTGHLSSALASSNVKLQVSQDNGVTWKDATVNGQQWFYNDTVNHTSNWSYKTRLFDGLNIGDSTPEQQVILDQTAPTGGGAISVDSYLQAGTVAVPVNLATVTANNGVRVTYNLAGTDAKVGDVVEITWGSPPNEQKQTTTVVAVDAAHPTTPASQVVVVFDASTIQSGGSSSNLPIKGRVIDAAGNTGPYSNVLNVSLDVVAPMVPTLSVVAGQPLADGYLNGVEQTQPLKFNLTGTGDAAAQAGDEVTLLVVNKATQAVVSTKVTLTAADIANGYFQTVLPSSVTAALVSGSQYDLRVQIKDKAGNDSAQAFQTSFTFDSIAPDAPTLTTNAAGILISTPHGDVASITTGGTTRDPYPTISGRAEANSKVSVFNQTTGVKLGEATVDVNGNWSFTVPANTPLADGTHTWYTVATDPAGNIDLTHKSSPVSFTVHATGPSQLITIDSMTRDSGSSATDFITNDGLSPRVVSGSLSAPLAAGEVLQVSLDNGATWVAVTPSGTAWTYNDTATHAGNWNIKARLVDGNGSGLVGAGAATQAVILDTAAPLAPTTTFLGSAANDGVLNLQDLKTPVTVSSNLTNTNAQVGDTLTFTWGSLTRKVVLTQSDITSNTVSTTFTLANLNTITDGTYKVSAQLTDLAGNVGAISEATYAGAAGSDNKSVTLGTHPPVAPRVILSSNLVDQVINLADYDARTANPYTITADLSNTNVPLGGKAVLIWGGVTVASTVIDQTTLNNRQVVWSLDGLIQQDGYDSTKWGGAHNVTVTLIDKVGNTSVPKLLGSFTVDTSVPDAPVIDKIDTTVDSTSSSIAVNGGTTSVQRPKIVGRGEPGALIAVFDDTGAQIDTNGDGLVLSRNSQGVLVNRQGQTSDSTNGNYDAGNYAPDYVTVDSTGAWTFQPPLSLANGLHAYTFKAVDSAFNVSAVSDVVSFTVDSHAPTQVVTIDAISQDSGFKNDFVTNIGSNQAVSGTVELGANGTLSADVKLVVVIDGVSYNNITVNTTDENGVVYADGKGHWTLQDTRAHSSNWGITAFLTDLTHHTTGAAISKSVVLDTVGPTAPLSVTVVDSSGNDLSTVATGVNAQNEAGVFLLVQFDPTQATANTEINVQMSSTTGSLRVLDLSATLSRTDINNGFVKIQVPQSVLDAAGTQGDVRFYVNLNDAAGNASPTKQTAIVHVDTVAPVNTDLLATVSGDNAISVADRAAGVTLSGKAEPGANVSLTWNVGDPASNTTTVLTRSSLNNQIIVGADGRWSVVIAASDIPDNVRYQTTLTVLQTDTVGNVSTTPVVSNVLLATKPPGPLSLDLTPSANPQFLFGDDVVNLTEKNNGVTISGRGGVLGATVKLSWDGFSTDMRVTDPTGAWSIFIPKANIPADTPDAGVSTIQVFQLDDLGNRSGTATHNVIIDTMVPTAPGINIVQGNDIVNLANEAAGVVVSGDHAEGGSTVFVSWRAADGRLITTSTTVVSNLGAWSVNFVDNAATPLPRGAHATTNFSVWQVDSAGNQSPINSRSVLVDTIAPDAPVMLSDIAVNIENSTSNLGHIPVSGTGEPDSRISVIIKGNANPDYWLTKNAVVDSAGRWTLDLVYSNDIIGQPPGSPAGTIYVPDNATTLVTILQTDSAGNVSSPFNSRNLLRDTTAPVAPTADVTSQVVGSDGTLDFLSGDPIINKAKRDSGFVFNLTGIESSAQGAQFKWGDGALRPVSATKNAAGVWQVSLGPNDIPFSAGAVVSYQLFQTDSAGNVTSLPSTRSVRIDQGLPSTPAVSFSDLHPDPTQANKSFLNKSNVDAGALTAKVSFLENIGNGASATVIWSDASGNRALWPGSSVVVTSDMRGAASLGLQDYYFVTFNANRFPVDATSSKITVVQTDSAGNVSSSGLSNLIQVDLTPPTQPSFGITGQSDSGILANVATETVAQNTDKFINKNERDGGITVVGRGEVGATVNLHFDTDIAHKKQAVVRADGTWSISFATNDIPAVNPTGAALTLTMTDTAGNVNTGGPKILDGIVIDALAPDLTPYRFIEQNLATGTHNDGVLNLDERNSGIVLSNSDTINLDIASVKVVWGSFTQTVATNPQNPGIWSISIAAGDLPATDTGTNGDHKSQITVHYFDASGNETTGSAQIGLPGNTNVDFVKLDYTAPTDASLTIDPVGIVNSAARSSANGIAVSGRGEANATVNIVWGNSAKNNVTVGADGIWRTTFNSTDNLGGDSLTSTISVTQTDKAGNVNSVARTQAVNLDTAAPTASLTIAAVSGNDIINSAEKQSDIVISGTAEAGATVNLNWAGLAGVPATGSTTASASGTWSITIRSASIPSDGVTQVVATQTDTAGNVGSASTTHAVTIDSAVPNAPTIFVVAGDDIVNATEKTAGVTVTGVAEANARGFVTWGNVSHAYTADATGNWSSAFSSSEVPTNGASIIANQTDTAGNISGNASRPVVVDTTTPTGLTINTVAGDGIINSAERAADVVLSGNVESGASVNVVWNGHTKAATVRTFSGAGTWNVTFAPSEIPADADSASLRTVTVLQTDSAGNVGSTVTTTVAIDTTISNPTINNVTDNLLGNNLVNSTQKTAGVSFTGSGEVNDTVNVLWGTQTIRTTVNASGSWSVNFPSSQVPSDGAFVVTVLQTDSAGNVSASSGANVTKSILIDTVVDAPVVNIATGAITAASGADSVIGSVVKSSDIYINKSESVNGFTMSGSAESGSATAFSKVNLVWAGGTKTVTADASGNWSAQFTAADVTSFGADGTYTISVTQTDTVGNVSAVRSQQLILDTQINAPTPGVSPGATINATQQASGVVVNAAAQPDTVDMVFTWNGQTYHATQVAGSNNWNANIPSSDIPTGPSTNLVLSVYAVDSAGNRSAVTTQQVNVDTVGPTTSPDSGFVIAEDFKVGGAERLGGFDLGGKVDPNSNIRVVLDDNAGHFITVNASSDASGVWSARVGNLPAATFLDTNTAYASITQLDAAGNSSTFVRTFKTTSTQVTLNSTSLALDNPNGGVYGTYSDGDKINFTFSEGVSVSNLNQSGAVSVAGKSFGTNATFTGVGNPDTIFMRGVNNNFIGQYSLLTDTAPTLAAGETAVGATTIAALKQSIFNNSGNTLAPQFDMLGGTNSVDLTKPIYKNGNKYILAIVGGGYVLADFSTPANATNDWYYSSDASGSFAGGVDPAASSIVGWFKASAPSTNQVGGTSSLVSAAIGAGFYNTVQLTLGAGTDLAVNDPIRFKQSSGSGVAGVFSGGGNTLGTATVDATTPAINFVSPSPTGPIVAEDSSGGDGVKNNSVLLSFNLATNLKTSGGLAVTFADLGIANGHSLGAFTAGTSLVGVGTASPAGFYTQWRLTYGSGFNVTTGDTITIPANFLTSAGGANPSSAVFTMPDIVAPAAAPTAPLETLDLDFNGAKNDGVVIHFSENIKLGNLLTYNAAAGGYQFSTAAGGVVNNAHNLGTNYKVIAIGADGKDLALDPSLSASSTSLAKDFRIEFGADRTITGNGTTNDTITISKAGVVDANGNTATGSVTYTMTDVVAPSALTPPLNIASDNVVNASEKTAGTSIAFTGGVVGERVHYYINGIELANKAATLTAVNPTLSLSASDWGNTDGIKVITTRLEDAEGNYSNFSGPKSVFLDTQVQGIKSVSVTNHPSASTTAFAAGDVIQLVFDEPVNLTTASLTAQFGAGASVSSQGSYVARSDSTASATLTTVSNTWNVTLGSSPTLAPGSDISLVSGQVKDGSGNTNTTAIIKTVPTDILNDPTSIIIDNVTSDNVINAAEGAVARGVSMKLTGAKANDVVSLYMDGVVVGSGTVTTDGQATISVNVGANGWGADGQRSLTAEIQRGGSSGTVVSSPIRSVYVAETQGHWSTLGTKVTWFDPDTLTTASGTNVAAAGGAGWTASVGTDGAGNTAVAKAPTAGGTIIQVRDASGHNVLVFNGATSASYLSFWQGTSAQLPVADNGIITVNATKLLSTAGSWNYTATFDLGYAGVHRRLHFGYGLDSQGFTAHWSGNGFNTPSNTVTANVWQTLTAYMDNTGESVLLNNSVIAKTLYTDSNLTGATTTQGRAFRIGTSVSANTLNTITSNATAQNAAPTSEYYAGLLGDIISIEGTYNTQIRAELNVYETVKFRAQGNYVTPNAVSVLYDLSGSSNSGALIDDGVLLGETKLGVGNDTVITAGADYVNVGSGNDQIKVKDLNFRQIDGGTGRDTLAIDSGYIGASTIELSDFVSNARGLATAGGNDNFTAADNTRVNAAGWHKLYGIENIDLATNTGAQTLRLRAADVKQLSDDNILRVNLGSGDRLELMDETSTTGTAQWQQWEGLFTDNGNVYTQKFVATDASGSTSTIYANGGVVAPHTIGAAMSSNVLSVAFDATLGTPPTDMSKFTLTDLSGIALATTVSSVTLTANSLGRGLNLNLSGTPAGAFIVNYTGSQINEGGTTRDTLVKKWYIGTSVGDTLDASAQTQSVGIFGLAGNNLLKGGSGSDVLVIDGAGNNTLTGGTDTSGNTISDTYVIRKGHTQGTVGGSDVITDFDKSDKLNLSDLLSNYTNDTTQSVNYLKLVGDGQGHLRLSIDKDGIPFGQSFTETNSVLLQGLSGITSNGNALTAAYIDSTLSHDPAALKTLLDQLIANHNIITH